MHALRSAPTLLALSLLAAGCGGGGGGGGGGAPAGGPSVPASLTSVPLILQEVLASGVAGAARTGEVVSFGMPFPIGEVSIHPTTGRPALAIEGVGAGAYQFRALRTWDDGSVAWALCDVQADLPAAPALNTDLEIAPGTGESSAADLATDGGATITVDTGPLQAGVLKAGFNLLDTVVVDGRQLVHAGTSPGVTGSTASGHLLAPSPATTVAIEENGPARAVIRVDGALRDQTTAADVVDFTCRLVFRADRRDVEAVVTVRNANAARPQHATGIEGLELALRVDSGINTTAMLAIDPDYTVAPAFLPHMDADFQPGEIATLYQGFTSAATLDVSGTPPQNYMPHLPKLAGQSEPQDKGYRARINGVDDHALGNKNDFPPNGWADLRGDTGGCTVAIRQMPYFWPAALELGGTDPADAGLVVASLFPPHGPAPYTFVWRQHESRTALFSFHASDADVANEPQPPTLARAFDVPLAGRAADYLQYDRAGVLPYRLLTVDEQNELYAALGVTNGSGTVPAPGQPHVVDTVNEPLTVTRYLRAGAPGGDNNHDSIERRLGGEWLRQGHGGPFLNAVDLALYKAEWQIQRSDGFLHATQPEVEGATNNGVPHTKQHQADLEHRYRDGMILAYFLTGDERLHEALLDEAEILPTLFVGTQERGMYMTLRALAFVAGFTGDPDGSLAAALEDRTDFFSDRQVNVATQTTGAGWEFTATDTGPRRYYVDSNQNQDEKPKLANGDAADEFFQARGFISGSLGPLALYHAGLALDRASAADPGDAGLAASAAKARGRMRDLAHFTRFELYPTNNAANGLGPSPVDWRWVYSYAVRLGQPLVTVANPGVAAISTSDFHPLLLPMAETYLDTLDPAWLLKGEQQLHAFAAHDNAEKASAHTNNLHEMESRLDAQHFMAVYREFLGL